MLIYSKNQLRACRLLLYTGKLEILFVYIFIVARHVTLLKLDVRLGHKSHNNIRFAMNCQFHGLYESFYIPELKKIYYVIIDLVLVPI